MVLQWRAGRYSKEHRNERTVSDKSVGRKRSVHYLTYTCGKPLPPAVTLPSLGGHGKDVSPRAVIRTRLLVPCHNCIGWEGGPHDESQRSTADMPSGTGWKSLLYQPIDGLEDPSHFVVRSTTNSILHVHRCGPRMKAIQRRNTSGRSGWRRQKTTPKRI
jgi:hypothetical protein